MRSWVPILFVIVAATVAEHSSRAAEPDAAELAALIDRHIAAGLKSLPGLIMKLESILCMN